MRDTSVMSIKYYVTLANYSWHIKVIYDERERKCDYLIQGRVQIVKLLNSPYLLDVDQRLKFS